MLDPDFNTVSVKVASAAYLAVGQVFSLLHELVAYAAVLIRLELHARDQLFDRASILLLYFFKPLKLPSGVLCLRRASPEYRL